MALAQGNGRAVASGRPFDPHPDARGKRAAVDSGRPRHRAEGTPQPCLRVTGAISSAVHPPCRSDCVVRTLKLGPVRPVRPAITARFRHRFSFTRGRPLVRSQPGPQASVQVMAFSALRISIHRAQRPGDYPPFIRRHPPPRIRRHGLPRPGWPPHRLGPHRTSRRTRRASSTPWRARASVAPPSRWPRR